MIIGRKQLRRLVEMGAVTGYVNINEQLQPNGFDLTLKAVMTMHSRGILDFDNKRRSLPRYRTLVWQKDLEGNEYIHLPEGVYVVTFNEKITIPTDMAVLTQPRSSLLRCGCSMGTAVGDAGYSGEYQALLDVRNPQGIILLPNAKLAQIIFIPLDEAQEGYNGIYGDKKAE